VADVNFSQSFREWELLENIAFAHFLALLWGIAARIFHLGWPIDISVRNIDRFVYRDVYRADLRSRGEDGALFPGCSSAHDQQTLCDISLLILRLTSATLSQGVSLS
jgi:hypothetical protein